MPRYTSPFCLAAGEPQIIGYTCVHRDLARHEFLRRSNISRDITPRCDPYVNNNISIHAEICNNLPGEIAGVDVDNNDVYCFRCNVSLCTLNTLLETTRGSSDGKRRVKGLRNKGSQEVAQEPENCLLAKRTRCAHNEETRSKLWNVSSVRSRRKYNSFPCHLSPPPLDPIAVAPRDCAYVCTV